MLPYFLDGTADNEYPEQSVGSSANGLDRNQYDRNGNPIDTTACSRCQHYPHRTVLMESGQSFWQCHLYPVDTLQHAFQNSNDMGGYTGQYNYLGNLGSPASHASFLTVGSQPILFTDPYDFCVQRPEDVIFTNTFSPFTNLSYYKGGGSRERRRNASNPILPSMQTKG